MLPLHYVDVKSLHEDNPDDRLAALVKNFQWEDWRELRFSEVDSEGYRRAVAGLADRLIEANARADRVSAAEAAAGLESAGEEFADEEAPGWLDEVAQTESTMPEWNETLVSIGREIDEIGRIMVFAKQDIDDSSARGKGLAARLTIASRVAKQLKEPTDNIYSLRSQFTSSSTRLTLVSDISSSVCLERSKRTRLTKRWHVSSSIRYGTSL